MNWRAKIYNMRTLKISSYLNNSFSLDKSSTLSSVKTSLHFKIERNYTKVDNIVLFNGF